MAYMAPYKLHSLNGRLPEVTIASVDDPGWRRYARSGGTVPPPDERPATRRAKVLAEYDERIAYWTAAGDTAEADMLRRHRREYAEASA